MESPCKIKQKYLSNTLRKDYLEKASRVIGDPRILINLVSKRVKQIKTGMKPTIESLEKLDPEDIALREIIEKKISYRFD